MSKATYPLKAARLDQGCRGASGQRGWRITEPMDCDRVAQKIGVVPTAAAFFRRRAERTKPDDLERIMLQVPDAPVEREDAIPPDLAKRLARLK